MDDIPMAQRTHSRGAGTQSASNRLSSAIALICFVAVVGLALLLLGRRFGVILPAPVPGLQARISSDGRLLGHFPYPEADPKTMVAVGPGLLLRPDAAERFIEMERAAAAAGVNLVPLSAFRSRSVQNQLFFDVKADRNQPSIERAKVSAPPGFSEHSTGYAIDIGDGSLPQANLTPMFAKTTAYQWLKDNAARFQFVLSFPEQNPQGVNFEPWHWRYEGSTDALRLFEPAQRLVKQRNGQVQP
ncbi:MAG: M15 family metallopeptidase [Cyanobacteriota bacterium]|nr:M15 family metallopeptidase [Cyanobacteriota bacterium]